MIRPHLTPERLLRQRQVDGHRLSRGDNRAELTQNCRIDRQQRMQPGEHGDDSPLSQGINERTDGAMQERPSVRVADAISVRGQRPGIAVRDGRVSEVLPVPEPARHVANEERHEKRAGPVARHECARLAALHPAAQSGIAGKVIDVVRSRPKRLGPGWVVCCKEGLAQGRQRAARHALRAERLMATN